MNRVLISPRVDKKIVNFFKDNGYEVVHFKEMNHVYISISDHLDAFVSQIDNKFVVEPYFYKENSKVFIGNEDRIIVGKNTLGKSYPQTVKYNCFSLSSHVIHNFKYTDESILNIIGKKEKIQVSQGYSNCNILKVDDKSIITSDRGIEKVAKKLGIDVLLIDMGYVNLRNQDYGFIGGASGILDDGSIFFLGDITCHPSYDKIERYLITKDVEYNYVKNVNLTDVGGFIIL